ncbi:ABC transporter substrate-binding protein [Cupriavidus sp. BIC8F]|uniref:ABC transporter substrate-binding protein n=1 Tax=Cupriavidus sp. BIC8F TaxID=3079014 RepID=UPI002916E245|nr:ABC transporter substrate-binding protein [Cupriavidus sp. BIC8F]
MKNYVLGASLCCAIAFPSVPAFAQQSPISDGEVRIGVLTDLSGIYSDLSGSGSVLAAKMAIEDFKAAHKPAFAIQLVSADHQNKPDVASNTARTWFDERKVDMIADVPASSTGLAVVKLAQQKGRMVIISGAASTRITNEDCTPTALHWTYDTYSLATGTAKAVLQRGGDTWYFITADYAGGRALEKDASDVIVANGGKIVGHTLHPFPGTDFSSYLLAAQASKAKVIALANAGNDTTNAIKQAVEFGITKKQALAATLMFITDVHSLGLEKAQGMYLTEGFYWDLDDQTRAWSKRFYATQKRMPTMVQAGVYSAVLHYLKSVAGAATDEPQAVLKTMRATPVSDMFARNGKLRSDGRMVHDMYLMQVKKPSESKYPWDYYHVRQVIPGDQAFLPLEKSKCPSLQR